MTKIIFKAYFQGFESVDQIFFGQVLHYEFNPLYLHHHLKKWSPIPKMVGSSRG